MKKQVALLVAALVLSGTTTLAADKIGFFNLQKVLAESQTGKDAIADLKKVYDKKQDTIRQTEEELKILKQNLEKQRTVLTEQAYREKEFDYEKKFREYKRLVQDSNEEMARLEKEASQRMIPEIVKVIQVLGKAEGYTAIFDINASGIAYFSSTNEMTDKVIDRYNKEHKGRK
ncbi:MAG: OmpH family outer membrane protein [Deltaproteobacteria bacterium]|nr:OmpH family outer membrane protein [Deltaproteobacteria bacterium]